MHWLGLVRHDVRYDWRLMRKSRLLSIATILTFTLGIGLDAGVFTLVNGLLFRPRVAHDPASFVEVRSDYAGTAGVPSGSPFVSVQDYHAYRRASSLIDLAAWTPAHATVGGSAGEDGRSHVALVVTCNFFAVYGPERPLIGRLLRPDDCAKPGASAIVVIGEDLWRTRLGADPAVVAFAVSRRTKEMGIRIALGATRRDIIHLVLSSGARPIAAGVAGGVVVAMLAAQVLARIFSRTPVHLEWRDPLAYAAVTIGWVATAIAAMFGPALRAASVDPVRAIGQD